MKSTIVILTLSLLAFSAFSEQMSWQAFKLRYEKFYTPEDNLIREEIFNSNMKVIERYQKEDPHAEYGITRFSDMTPEEFAIEYLGLKASTNILTGPLKTIDESFLKDIPDLWDWRDHGAVTPVKNQVICGSCWAFSAVGNIEGQYFFKQNTLRNLSEQQLVDCDTLDQGCDGGQMQNAFTWLSENGGLEPTDYYPYFGFEGTCKINKGEQIVQLKGYMNITQDENVIAESLYQYGPLSTGVNGNKLQFYKSGIFSPKRCSTELDHGVLLVGYGTGDSDIEKEKDVDYWLVKNSWGADWGENGYFRIARGSGMCGINLDVSTSLLAD